MKPILTFALILLTGVVLNEAEAQCSDAGVCSIGHDSAPEKHFIALAYSFGRSAKADDLTFHEVNIEASFVVFESSRIFASIPWSAQNGPLGSVRGIGDVIVGWDQVLLLGSEESLSLQAGVKLATGSSNSENLPQRYQSGLGSNDILLGLSYTTSRWNASIGYQAAGGRSSNDVDRLKRGDDAMLRVGYQTTWESVTPSIQMLAIKRLGKSSVRGATTGSAGTYFDLPNSDQFQVNVLGSLLVPIQESLTLNITAAVPLLNREVNVDGLTRSLTLGTGIAWTF